MKKFVIIDLSKDVDLTVNNAQIFQLSCGITKLKNSTLLNKKFFSEKKFKKFREKVNTLLFNFYNYLKTDKSKNDLLPLELFNSRNDKNQIYNKLFYLLEIIDYVKKKKIKNLEIITDDYSFYDTYKSIKLANVNIICLNKDRNSSSLFFYFKKTLFFHLKTFIFVFFTKFFKDKKVDLFENSCISIYPIFFKNEKNFLFNKNYLNINFQITDETHLNNSLFKNLESFFEIKKLNNTISIESYISLIDVIKNFFISMFNYFIIKKAKNFKFEFIGLNVDNQFFSLFFNSFINKNKVNIYEQPLSKVIEKFQIKKFHYYLFEYSFGHCINYALKKNNPSVETVGYQHGIYSERLMWQDFSKRVSYDNFYPDKIVCKYFHSLKTYKNNFIKKKIIFFKSKKDKKNKLVFKKNKYSVFLGLHDCYNMINGLRKLNQKKEFMLNFHPKLKRYNPILNLPKNMKIYGKNKNFLKILSTTSTIPYQLITQEKFYIFVPNNIIPLNPPEFDKLFLKN